MFGPEMMYNVQLHNCTWLFLFNKSTSVELGATLGLHKSPQMSRYVSPHKYAP